MDAAGLEIELKFALDPARLAAARRALGPRATAQRLQALYVDTADARLAGAGLALRMRHEGSGWVQTLKGRGADLLTRREHEVPVPANGRRAAPPPVDPDRHAGTPVGDALAALLADGASLQPRYATDIQRLSRVLRSGASRVEVALDTGRIAAGRRRLAVCEVEFELLEGRGSDLVALAAAWARRLDLQPDTRTKSERGHRLAAGWAPVPALHAAPAAWDRGDATPAAVFAVSVQSAAQQALVNATEIAAGDGSPEHLHQLRVGLRRLRTALKLFAPWSADPAAAAALDAALRAPFGRLGALRDSDALGDALLPAIEQARRSAGLPDAAPGAAPSAESAADGARVAVRDPALRDALLEALALAGRSAEGADGAGAAGESGPGTRAGRGAAAESEGPGPAGVPPGLHEALRAVLQPLWKQAARDAARFDRLDDDGRHRLRRRLKRLRYACEFLRPALRRRGAEPALRRLRRALGALGAYNDAAVAQAAFARRAAADPQAAFAVGWLVAHREVLAEAAARALRAWSRVERPWRGAR